MLNLKLGLFTFGKFFTFGSKSLVEVSTVTTSRKRYIKTGGAISITSGTGHYRINGGSWVNTAGTVVAGDYVEARLTSSASYSTALELVFSIAGASDTFTVTTMADNASLPYTLPFILE